MPLLNPFIILQSDISKSYDIPLLKDLRWSTYYPLSTASQFGKPLTFSLSILPHWTLNANLTKLLDLLQGPSTYMPLCHWQCCPFYLKYSFYPTDLAHPSFLYLADAIKFFRQFPQPSYTYTHICTNTPVYTSRSSHKHPWVFLHTSIPISTIQGIVTNCVHYCLSPLDMSNVFQQLAGTSGTL